MHIDAIPPPGRLRPVVVPASSTDAAPPLTLLQVAALVLGWAFVLVGLALRLYHAGANSVWFDEVASIAVSAHPWSTVMGAVQAKGNFFPPLFPYLLKLWMLPSTSDGWMRSGTALLGGGVVALTWSLGRRLFGTPTALVATLYCALAAYEIYFSQYLRMYVLLSILALASLILLLKATETNRTLWWALWAVCAAACLYTFYYAIFLLVGEGLWLATLAVRRPELRVPVVLWSGVVVVLFLPWLPSMHDQVKHTGERAWIPRPSLLTLKGLWDGIFFYSGGKTLVNLGRYPMALLVALGLLLPGQRKERGLLFSVLACGILVPFVASRIIQSFFDPRYLVYAAAPLYLVAARGAVKSVELLGEHFSPRLLVPAVAVMLAVIAALAIRPLHQLYTDRANSQADVGGAITMILHDRQPNDVVVHDDGFSFLPAIWYAYRDAGAGPYSAYKPYAWLPKAWVQQAPLHQVLIGRHFSWSADWLLGPGKRLWIISTSNFRLHHNPTHVDAWYYPPADQWKLARADTRFLGLYVRLYVRSQPFSP